LELLRPIGDRRCEAFEADQRGGAAPGGECGVGHFRDHRFRQMRSTRDFPGGAYGLAERGDGALVVEPGDHQRRRGFRAGQHLEGHVGDDGERAPGTGEALGQIVAGDVLHHAPARLERLAASGDGVYAEHVVAGSPRLDPPRAADVAGEHAADRAAPARSAVEWAEIHRLEGERLVVLLQ
jgi:hypothetical protein